MNNHFTFTTEKKSKSPEAVAAAKRTLYYAMFNAIKLVLSGIVGGLALAIALILQTPINSYIGSLGITDPNAIAGWTAFIYFIVAMIVVIILIPISRAENKYKD